MTITMAMSATLIATIDMKMAIILLLLMIITIRMI